MGFLSFLKGLKFWGKTEKPTVVESPVKNESPVEVPKVEIKEEPTKIIEKRLAEIAAEKKVEVEKKNEPRSEKKVTAKDIKAKVKKAPETKTVKKQVVKKTSSKSPKKKDS